MNKLYTIAFSHWRKATVALMMLLWLLPMTSQAQQFIIGTGTAVGANPGPYDNVWEGIRAQFIYRSAELNAMPPGAIVTHIAFRVGAAAPANMLDLKNFRVWVANTNQNDVATAFVPQATLGPVRFTTPLYTAHKNPANLNNYFDLPLSTPFVWTGGNIVVQVVFNNNTVACSQSGTEWATSTNVQRTVVAGLATARRLQGDGYADDDFLLDALPPDPTFCQASGGVVASTSRANIRFTAIPPTPCVNPVGGGTTVSSVASFCGNAGASTTLSVTGLPLAAGFTFVWEQSTNGGVTWTPAPGNNTQGSYDATGVTQTTQYRRVTTCTTAPTSNASSVPYTFADVSGAPVYAALPYIQDFENWQDKCKTKDIPVEVPANRPPGEKYWKNTPDEGPLSWRRQNEGVAGKWNQPNNNIAVGNVVPISGTGAATFHAGGFATTGNAMAGQQGWMDLNVNMSSSFTKEVRFLYRNRQQYVYVEPTPGADRQWLPVHTDAMEVLLSTDGGVTFPTTIGTYYSETLDSIPPAPVPSAFAQSINKPLNWKRIAVKVAANSPTVVIRFRATTSPFYPLPIAGGIQSDIAIDDVEVVEIKPCSAILNRGKITGEFRLCDPASVNLGIRASDDLLGAQDFEFLWLKSTDNVTFTPADILPNQPNNQGTYTTPVLGDGQEPYYVRRMTCKNGGAVAYSDTIRIRQIRPVPVAITPGIPGRYVQLFENWINGCRDKQLPDAAWKNTPNIGNLSWRRNQDVFVDANNVPNVGQWFVNFIPPASSLASLPPAPPALPSPATVGCAEFFSTGTAGNNEFDLYVDMSASTNKKAVQFYIRNTNGTDVVSVQTTPDIANIPPTPIGLEAATPNPAWNRKGYIIESNSANQVIRFLASGDPNPLTNNSNIGLDSLIVIDLVPCSKKPWGGFATASPANFCAGTEVSISVSSNLQQPAPFTFASDDPAWATDDLHIFRWQVSTDNGVTWNNIANQQAATYRFTATAQPNNPARQYRRKIMCPVDTINMVSFSNAVTLDFPYPMAYAKIPYYQGFDDVWTAGGNCTTGNASDQLQQANIRPVSPVLSSTNLIQNDLNEAVPARNQHWRSVAGNNRGTWRRISNPATAGIGWVSGGSWGTYGRVYPLGPPTTGANAIAPIPASLGAAGFNGFGGNGQRTGNLELYVDASGTQMKQLRFRFRNPQRPLPVSPTFTAIPWPEEEYNINKDKLEVEMSFDNGLSFGSPVELGVAPTWLPNYINFNNDKPQTVIRFKGTAQTTQSPTQFPRPEGTDMGIDEVYIVYVDDCASATALAGGIAANTPTIAVGDLANMPTQMPDFNFCYSAPYAVYVTGASDETHYGFTYKWEFSVDGVLPYVPLDGLASTRQNYLMTVVQTGFYRRVITCTATGNSATSTPVQLISPNPLVFAKLPYRQDFENWGNGCGTNDRPADRPKLSDPTGVQREVDQSWRNSPFTGNSSWRRQNQGRDANWNFNFPEALPTVIYGQGCATFHNFFIEGTGTEAPPSTAAQGRFDLYIDCSTPGTKQLRFWYTNPDVPNSLEGLGNEDKLIVQYSTNGGTNFQPLVTLAKQEGWAERSYTFNSTSTNTIIRFLVNWNADDSDIGIDEVRVDALAGCATATVINGGTALPSTVDGNPCNNLSLLLYVKDSSSDVLAGLTYKWERSLFINGAWGPWEDAKDDNGVVVKTPTYEISSVQTTRFRRVSTCPTSGLSGSSEPYNFVLAGSPEYATLPYTEDFEIWGDACGDDDVPLKNGRFHWVIRPFTGNLAWRQARVAVPGTPTYGAYIASLSANGWTGLDNVWTSGASVIPASGNGAASFHSFAAPIGLEGKMELYVNANTPTTEAKMLQFDYSNRDFSNGARTNEDLLEVYVSIDGGATYTTSPIATFTRTIDLWETKRIVFDNIEQPNLNSPTTVFRFKATSDNGGTDMGVDNMSFAVLPQKDAAITAIDFNRCSPVYGRVVVEVANFGATPIQEFPIQYTLNGETFVEFFPFRLERFQSMKYEFANAVKIANPNVPTLNITAKTNLPGDLVPANDAKTVNVIVVAYSGLIHEPVSDPLGKHDENFDAGIPVTWQVQGKRSTSSWFSAIANDLDPATPTLANEFPFETGQIPGFGGNGFENGFAALDDNKGGAARTFDADRLVTPAFDFRNYQNIQVSFDAFNSVGPAYNPNEPTGGTVTFQYSTDNGLSWTSNTLLNAEIKGDKEGGQPHESRSYTIPVLAGKDKVRFCFVYNDRNKLTGGAAIDNFKVRGTVIQLPEARVTTTNVNRAFVNRNTDGHVVYRFSVEGKDADVLLTDVLLKTGDKEYKVEDFKDKSFRLIASTDTILSVSDVRLSTVAVVPKGTNAIFSCLNYVIPKAQKAHFFFTVDVAQGATIGDSINVQLPVVTEQFITIVGARTGASLSASGYQIIANPNNPPTSKNVILITKKKEKESDANLIIKRDSLKFIDIDAPFVDVNVFKRVRIVNAALPPGAKLQFNGVDVTSNLDINVADLGNANTPSKLVFIPDLNKTGINYASFTFKVYDGRDWSNTDYNVRIDVISDKIFVPTLFSPNGDTNNDVFLIYGGEGNIDNLKLKILDRNNNPIFETSDVNEIQTKGWDGKKGGKDQPMGSYIWYIEGKYRDGKPIEFNGKKTGVIRLVR